MLSFLNPEKTILRSNHVSNFLNLAGSYPKDRLRLIAEVEAAISQAGKIPGYLNATPATAKITTETHGQEMLCAS